MKFWRHLYALILRPGIGWPHLARRGARLAYVSAGPGNTGGLLTVDGNSEVGGVYRGTNQPIHWAWDEDGWGLDLDSPGTIDHIAWFDWQMTLAQIQDYTDHYD